MSFFKYTVKHAKLEMGNFGKLEQKNNYILALCVLRENSKVTIVK